MPFLNSNCVSSCHLTNKRQSAAIRLGNAGPDNIIMFEFHILPPSCIMYPHASQKAWQSNEISVNVLISKGERCIIVDAGSEDNFVKGDRLIYDGKSTSGDYHCEMNSEKFIHTCRLALRTANPKLNTRISGRN